jgi:hypothetical protein
MEIVTDTFKLQPYHNFISHYDGKLQIIVISLMAQFSISTLSHLVLCQLHDRALPYNFEPLIQLVSYRILI